MGKEDRPLLMLKPEHWGRSEGPPIREGSIWWYVGCDGKPVRERGDADSYGEAASKRFRVAFSTLDDRDTILGSWLPMSKAPQTWHCQESATTAGKPHGDATSSVTSEQN